MREGARQGVERRERMNPSTLSIYYTEYKKTMFGEKNVVVVYYKLLSRLRMTDTNLPLVYFQQNKKKTKGEGVEECHVETMMNTKADKTVYKITQSCAA